MGLLKLSSSQLANWWGLIRLPEIKMPYISWTLNALGWIDSQSLDSIGAEYRPFIDGTYIVAESNTVFNISGLLSTDEVWFIDYEGIADVTVIDGQIQLVDGQSYGGFKVERNGIVIGIFPIVEGLGLTLFNQITDGVLGNAIIAGSAIDLWQFSAIYSNTANKLGHSAADGSTMYSDKLGSVLIPEGTIVPVDVNNTSKICAYDISGNKLDATYTGTAKINLIASTPTYTNYATDNSMVVNVGDFASLVGVTLSSFRWETTCKLVSSANFEGMFYFFTNDSSFNLIELFDSPTDGIYATFLGSSIKSTDFGSAVHLPTNVKFTAFLEYNAGVLKIGWAEKGVIVQEFSANVTPNIVDLIGGTANARVLTTTNIGDIFYNSKTWVDGTLINEYVNFGTDTTVNLEQTTLSVVSGTTVDLKTYVDDNEAYHYRNGFSNWIKEGEADRPAILNNQGGQIFDYSGDGFSVEETVNAGFTGMYPSIDAMYRYEKSKDINYQIPEIYTNGDPNLLTYSEVKSIDNAGVLLTEDGTIIEDLRVYARNNEAVPIPEGYNVGINKTDAFTMIGCDPRIDEVLNKDITYFYFETVCTFSTGVLIQLSDLANGQTQTITLQVSSNIVRLYREIDNVQYNNLDVLVPYSAPVGLVDNDYSNSVRITALSNDGLSFSLKIEFFKTGEIFEASGAYPSVYNHIQTSFKLGKGNNNGSRTVAGVSYVKLDLNSYNYYYVFRYDFYTIELYTGRVERFDFANTTATQEQLSIPSDYIDGIYKNGYKLWYNPIPDDYRKTFKLENGSDNTDYTSAGYSVVLDVNAGDTTMYGVSIDLMGLFEAKNDTKSKLLDTQNIFFDTLGDTKSLTYSELDAVNAPYFTADKSVTGQITDAKLTGTYSIVPNFQMPYSDPYYAIDIENDLGWKTDTKHLLYNQDGTAKQYLYSELTALQNIDYIQITLNGAGNPLTFKLLV